MIDFDIKNFNPSNNYVIEASAGTGKTYNIVQMVSIMVRPPYNIPLEKILIVTYTEKAAGELRDRIRGKLLGYKDEHGNEINFDVDNAPIFTFHSFCQKTIAEFGISANLPLKLDVVDDNALERFIDRYIREGEILKYVSKYVTDDKNLNKITSGLKKTISRYYLDSHGNEDSTIISICPTNVDDKFDTADKLSNATTLEQYVDAFPNIKSNYNIIKMYADKGVVKAIDCIDKLNKNFNDNKTLKFGASKGIIIKSTKTDPLPLELTKASENLLNEANRIYGCNDLVAPIVEKFLPDLYKKWQKEKEINKSQSFDDMIRYVREAILQPNSVLKQKLQQKYSHAIIDEFQDTNQKQFDIFSSIFMSDNDHHIVVVGDPKQSIYSFQGSDINVYYQATNKIINGQDKYIFNRNYRSTKEMVLACNALFKNENFLGDSFTECGYIPDDDPNGTHQVMFDNQPTKAIWLATEDGKIETIDRQQFAEIAVQQMVMCCSKPDGIHTRLQIKDRNKDKEFRNVRFGDFAILVRKRSEANEIEREMRKVGIPCRRYKDEGLYGGIECAHWIALLEAIDAVDFTGSNRNTLRKALFTRFLNVSLAEIGEDKFNKDDNPQVELLNKWKMIANEHRYEDLINSCIVDSGIVRRMNDLSMTQSLSIYKQIGDFCIEYLTKNQSLTKLISALKTAMNGDDIDEDEGGAIIERGTDLDCVTIMTCHSSKGLQYPVVISAAGYGKQVNNDLFYVYHETDAIDSKTLLGFERNESVDKDALLEWNRLFYVTYTRAQFIMIMPFFAQYAMKGFNNAISAFVMNESKHYKDIKKENITKDELKAKVALILQGEQTPIDTTGEMTQMDELEKLIKQKSNKSSYKHSYSSLSHGDESFDEDDLERSGGEGLKQFDMKGIQIECKYSPECEPLKMSNNYPKGTKIGTALHEVFELMDFTTYTDHSIRKLITECFERVGIIVDIDHPWVKETKLMVDNVINAKLPTKDGFIKLKDINPNDCRAEMEFNFNLLNESLRNYANGFVDLVFRKDNKYYVLDWKSDRLNDDFTSYSDKDSLKNHVDNAYSIQRVLYSYCLIDWMRTFYVNKTNKQIFDEYFGGVYYVFLRGCNTDTSNGVYSHAWSTFEDLEEAFNNIINTKVNGGKKND